MVGKEKLTKNKLAANIIEPPALYQTVENLLYLSQVLSQIWFLIQES